MTPSIESRNPVENLPMEPPTTTYSINKAIMVDPPNKTVTFAVNYEVAMVDQFLCAEKRTRATRVETPTSSTTRDLRSISGNTVPPVNEVEEETTQTNTSTTESDRPSKSLHDEQNDANEALPCLSPRESRECDETSSKSLNVPKPLVPNTPVLFSPECSTRRISTRDKHKREAPLVRNQVRYDMQAVPRVRRNLAFLNSFEQWWLDAASSQPKESAKEMPQCDAKECVPFEDNSSVLWIPAKRSEWEDSISEMTAVYTCAVIQRLRLNASITIKTCDNTNVSPPTRPFVPPISSSYVRDRIDIDDPLHGYQIRHKHGGWLQGFILFTQFTTWTYDFHWDSQHEVCGIPLQPAACRRIDDGSLARELDTLPRSGDPGVGGIVFPAIAEISLLGGLGCGQYLLRMALDDIRAKGTYQYVALDAAEDAVPFYERFGFVRVGAICQYRKPTLPSSAAPSQQPTVDETPENAVVGYRHWTNSNESERSLQMRGPSYMMCLKLPDVEAPIATPTFVTQMLSLRAETKPRVEFLGASATPGLKVSARRNSMPVNISACHSGSSSPREGPPKRGRPPRRKSMVVSPTPPLSTSTSNEPAPKVQGPITAVQSLATGTMNPPAKPPRVRKRAVATTVTTKTVTDRSIRKRPAAAAALPSRRPAGRPLTFAEKQYHSVWLAVPPPAIPTTVSSPRATQKSRAKKPIVNTKATAKTSKLVETPVVPKRKRGRPPKSAQKENHPKPPVTPKIKSRATFSMAESGRLYHSIRGPDGKFMRVYADESAPLVTTKPSSDKRSCKKPSVKRPAACVEPPTKKRRLLSESLNEKTDRRSVLAALLLGEAPTPIDKKTYRKQKVKSYPRNHVHFYNRVVKPKTATSQQDNLYFVSEYEEEKGLLRLIPMVASGTLLGQREGRPRYQCAIGDTDENFKTVPATDYVVVRSAVVMKTPFIAAEAWDVETDADSNFQTR